MVGDFLRKAADALLGDQQAEGEQAPRPASEDPYGDPATQGVDAGQFGDVRPASEDPYGDPANQMADGGQFGDVRPASEDPYGDPADQA